MTKGFFDTNEFVTDSFADQAFRSIASVDLIGLVNALGFLLDGAETGLIHPVHPTIKTFCRGSIEKERINYIIFSDCNGDNIWTIVQIRNAVDAIFFDDSIYQFPFALDRETLQTCHDSAVDDLLTKGKSHARVSIKGFLLTGANPFHYFYDRFVNLFLFDMFRKFNDLALFYTEYDMYVEVEEHFRHKSLETIQHQDITKGCYLHPNLLNGRLHCIKNQTGFVQTANSMELNIAQTVERASLKTDYDLVLWFGITGSKRRWVEQVEAYSQIANSLACKHNSILLYIDGMTNCNKRSDTFHEDISIFNELAAHLKDNVTAHSLVGATYSQKISHCKNVDAYIANSGTGSIVPAKFCRKPGILHGNTRLFAFPGLEIEGTQFIPINEITDVFEGSESERSSLEHWSYSISPDFVQKIFEEIVDNL